MARSSKINDVELGRMVALGMTQEEIAKEFGCSQPAVAKRIAYLKEQNPMALEIADIDDFRETESDQLAKFRQLVLDEMIKRSTSNKGLNRESLPQLVKAYAIAWDKDEKIQTSQVRKVAHLHQITLDKESEAMLGQIIDRMTNKKIEAARTEKIEMELIAEPGLLGDSSDDPVGYQYQARDGEDE